MIVYFGKTTTTFAQLTRFCRSGILALAVVMAGCATTSPGMPRQESDNPAVMSLLNQARVNLASGHFANAEASLERALRIEQGNAYLWYELATLSLHQADYRQAENRALRADSFAGQNKPLKDEIWRLISEARAGLGNDAGARKALRKARRY